MGLSKSEKAKRRRKIKKAQQRKKQKNESGQVSNKPNIESQKPFIKGNSLARGEGMKLKPRDENVLIHRDSARSKKGTLCDQTSINVLSVINDKSMSSVERSNRLFSSLIHPINPKKFYQDFWEAKHLLIQRQNPNFYMDLFTSAEIWKLLEQQKLSYGRNIDVAKYSKGRRTTLNKDGFADLHEVKHKFRSQGCTVRMLHPQEHFENIWKLLSVLEEHWGCQAGCNAYLTPKGSQGFAPHYDDIEAFVLQLEGAKRWRVYLPRNPDEVLPRTSSPNFQQEEIGDAVLDVVLESGDLLYFPRGFIHQAEALADQDSLHITVSTGQRGTWLDFLDHAVPLALELAGKSHPEFRQSLPRNFRHYMGIMHQLDGAEMEEEEQESGGDNQSMTVEDCGECSESEEASKDQSGSEVCDESKMLDEEAALSIINTGYDNFDAETRRLAFKKKAMEMFAKTIDYLIPDAAVDSLQKQFMWERLPPFLPKYAENQNGKTIADISLDTCFRMKGADIARLTLGDDENEDLRIYYNLSNSRTCKEEQACFIECPEEFAEAVKFILNSYPATLQASDIPLEEEQDKISVVAELVDKGIVHVEPK